MSESSYQSLFGDLLLELLDLLTDGVNYLLFLLDSVLGVLLDETLGMPLEVGDEFEGLALLAFAPKMKETRTPPAPARETQ